MNLVELFCHVDDFCQAFEVDWIRHQLTTGHRRRRRTGRLCLSEIMTLLIWFHQSHYRTFKAFYQHHVCIYLRGAFPGLVSYGRFVELIEHTRHRSLVNFMVNILCGLIAYCHQPKNPATAPIAGGLTRTHVNYEYKIPNFPTFLPARPLRSKRGIHHAHR